MSQTMHPASGVIICLAYILGLLSTASPWGGYTVLVLGVAAAACRFWRMGPKPGIWLTAGLVGLLASFYLPMRVPQPLDNDIRQKNTPAGLATGMLYTGRVMETQPVEINYGHSRISRH